ncbi:MAG: septum formation initiator family protein [Propionicimonas sp.]|uniref:FtsB family cell division protein n=1 Tax=Propionicimonas sp. TaxID=1955623 RepID=UPI002B1ECA50|nr:septum formation initiator family protein [Propionicimonas sp.]MEA4943475.1 septum formation initiator family protein [Propionicimonas sp.]MEA5051931.1 septum formation initiator family protein [Propionicimonas sp.]MEA5117547.1 septum formation initiator family protein [Propionicimonas sp.]
MTEPLVVETAPPRRLPPLRRLGAQMTGRALVVVVVVVMLALSYASSLRIYLDQQHELAVAEQEVRERSAQINDLEDQLARWDDPAYVKAQARDRLGWVMPGEIGYRVVDEEGKPIGGGVVIDAEQQLPADEQESVWSDRLWGSIRAADAPARKVTTR